MKKIKYIFKRLLGMDYKAMFRTVGKVHKRSGKSRIIIFFDMLYCSYKYMAGYTDYFLFYFEDLNKKQRSTYITRGINTNYIRRLNDREYYKYFRDKVLFNDTFKKYIKRDYIDLTRSSVEEFKDFLKRNKTVIIKPVDETGGHGISKLVVDKSLDINKLYNELIETKRTLVEECVKQHKTMNKLSSNSVNTLRIVTINDGKDIHIMLRCIRFGNGINPVDNFHSGGMYTFFNEDGVIEKKAVDREGQVYDVHPYTKEKIVGFKIPDCDKAIKMVKEAAKVIPQIRYIGFDVAISEDGPLLIEGNELPGYDLYQSKVHLSEDKEGLKPKFDEILKNID